MNAIIKGRKFYLQRKNIRWFEFGMICLLEN